MAVRRETRGRLFSVVSWQVKHIDDSFAFLSCLADGAVDVIITDPPYSKHVHENMSSGTAMKRQVEGGAGGGIPRITLPFGSLQQYAFAADLARVAKRWALSFCAVEDFGEYRRAVGPEQWVRGGIWYKPNCLAGRTVLYAKTQKGVGPHKLEHLTRLDPSTVQLWNGQKWTQVVAWYDRASDPSPSRRIVFRNGERVACTGEHLWPTARGLLKAEGLVVGDVVDSCRLPDVAVEPSNINDLDVAYFVGLFLAEGSISSSAIQIAGHVDETERRFEFLSMLARGWGGTCRAHKTGGKSATINLTSKALEGVLATYLRGTTSKTKHLAPRAWRESDAFLRALLEGYLHGDGSFDRDANRWRIGFTDNRAWMQDLRTLSARLGKVCVGKRVKHKGFGKEFWGYRAEIREASQHHNARPLGEIVKIEKAWGDQFWDVEVADEPHTFALASGILTHNSMGQLTGDRPANAYEGIAIMHRKGKKQWNGRGSFAYWSAELDHELAHFQCNGTRGEKDRHPNQKPLNLCLELVAKFTNRGETVFDPFAGSGRIGEACVLLGRNYLGLERDAGWVAKAEARLAAAEAAPALRDEDCLRLCAAPKKGAKG